MRRRPRARVSVHENGNGQLDRDGRELTVYVAALTRRRSRMLEALLASWSRMAIPERCRVTCLIVENDTSELSKPVLDGLRPRFDRAELRYVLEPSSPISASPSAATARHGKRSPRRPTFCFSSTTTRSWRKTGWCG